jgi:hypothetical protein
VRVCIWLWCACYSEWTTPQRHPEEGQRFATYEKKEKSLFSSCLTKATTPHSFA